MLKIFTYACGPHGAKFVDIQHRSLKRNILDDFDYTVFNTSDNDEDRERIRNACAAVPLRHVVVDKTLASGTHPCGLIHSWREYALKEPADHVLMLDFDMALMEPFSVANFVADHDVVGIGQSRGWIPGGDKIFYLWPGIIMWNMKTAPALHEVNLDGGTVDGIPVDVGGQLCHWFRAHPEIKYKSGLTTGWLTVDDPLLPDKIRAEYDPSFRFDVKNGCFLHFGAGSNWNHMPTAYHAKKMELYERVFS
jgi:hypothetical protein